MPCESGFRHLHSAETALLRTGNDILMLSDAGDCSVVVLRDPSSAFDTVDHNLLIDSGSRSEYQGQLLNGSHAFLVLFSGCWRSDIIL